MQSRFSAFVRVFPRFFPQRDLRHFAYEKNTKSRSFAFFPYPFWAKSRFFAFSCVFPRFVVFFRVFPRFRNAERVRIPLLIDMSIRTPSCCRAVVYQYPNGRSSIPTQSFINTQTVAYQYPKGRTTVWVLMNDRLGIGKRLFGYL